MNSSFRPIWTLLLMVIAVPLIAQEGRSRGSAAGDGAFSGGGYSRGGFGRDSSGRDSIGRADDRSRRIRLGVRVRDLETGVRLTDVAEGSVADRNGLESGDTVLAVAGFQVGYVDGRLYDLGDEIARNVDRRGQVTLLVHRARDGRVVNNYVTLEEPAEEAPPEPVPTHRVALRGEIAGRPGARLSDDAIQTARILDITNPSRPVVVNRAVERDPGQFPLNFGIAFGARPDRRYAIDAVIYDGGRQYQTERLAFDSSTNRDATVRLRIVSEAPAEDPIAWYRSNLGRRPSSEEQAAWRELIEAGYAQDEIVQRLRGGERSGTARLSDVEQMLEALRPRR